MERVALVTASLNSGGAERDLSLIANYWAERGVAVVLVTVYPESLDFYPLHPAVERVALDDGADSRGVLDAVVSNVRRVRKLRSVLRAARPDAVVSFMESNNVQTILATAGMRVPVVVSDRTDPTHTTQGWAWARLRRALYPRADAVVVLTRSARAEVTRFVPEGRVRLIPNPLPERDDRDGGADPPSEALLREVGDAPLLVAAGRLVPVKGFDLLLEAFAPVAAARPGWRLAVLGEGPERERLEAQARGLGLAGRVLFPGRVRNPLAVMRRAELFVLSSRAEGFGNVLLEAMGCGLPVVATDCVSGPGEIVRDGVDGVLVPPFDAPRLAGAMARLMDDPAERRRLGAAALSVRERFAQPVIMERWTELLEQLIRARTPPL